MGTLHDILLTLHSLTRWFVIIVGLLAVVRGLLGWRGGKPWSDADDRAGMLLTIGIDVQLLLGLALYVGFGWLSNAAGGRIEEGIRFFAIEHLVMMLLALVLVHVGRATSRRADDPAGKHKRAFIWYGLAMLVILLAIPWPFLAYGRPWLRLPGM